MTILIILIYVFYSENESLKWLRTKNYFSSVFTPMSTTAEKFPRFLIFCLAILLLVATCSAQDFEATIKLISPATVRIEGKFLRENSIQSNKNWAFARSIGNVENLGARVSDLNLTNKSGQSISVKKLIDGEYLADDEASAWSYQINLNPPQDETAMAHISWLKNEQGILMLDDLLPQFIGENNQPLGTNIKFELPKDWKILSSEKSLTENIFRTRNVEKAIFLVGKNWREREISNKNLALNLAISDEWNFTDAEAVEMISEIFAVYQKLFGEIQIEKVQISLVHFPKEIKFGRWEAETRGANLTIFSSDMPFKTLSRQRLHEQLRHELFHLWIPNNLALMGNYAWFYEGFTVYQSLKTGVQMNQIRFEDFLDTLSQAFQTDNFQTQKISLIEASKNRWNDANPNIYARGMLVAFLCDVILLRENKGKIEVADIFRQLYKLHRLPNKVQDGTIAVLDILGVYPKLQPIIEKYIKGIEKIDWQADLESVGIEMSKTDAATKLSIKAKLNGRQKDLLDKLGYNNWRKTLEKSK